MEGDSWSWINTTVLAVAISYEMRTRQPRICANTNLRKHGIHFADAETVFMDPLFVFVDASRNSETRDAVIGFNQSGRLLFVVHIALEGDGCIRTISARAAEPAEEALYAQ